MNLLLTVSRIHDRLPHLTDYPAVYVNSRAAPRGPTAETLARGLPVFVAQFRHPPHSSGDS
jgi:hypothetical protein